MTKRVRNILLTLGGIIVVVLIASFALAWHVLSSFDGVFDEHPHRSDAEMIRNFTEHRQEFDQVLAMALADKNLRRVDDNWTDPTNLASERVAEYRRLFEVIETPRGISKYGAAGRVEFLASTLGWVASGSTKGYLYTEPKPAGTFVGSLDDVDKLRVLSIYYLRPLEDNWYLYFQR